MLRSIQSGPHISGFLVDFPLFLQIAHLCCHDDCSPCAAAAAPEPVLVLVPEPVLLALALVPVPVPVPVLPVPVPVLDHSTVLVLLLVPPVNRSCKFCFRCNWHIAPSATAITARASSSSQRSKCKGARSLDDFAHG
jgi:hypothetical protein